MLTALHPHNELRVEMSDRAEVVVGIPKTHKDAPAFDAAFFKFGCQNGEDLGVCRGREVLKVRHVLFGHYQQMVCRPRVWVEVLRQYPVPPVFYNGPRVILQKILRAEGAHFVPLYLAQYGGIFFRPRVLDVDALHDYIAVGMSIFGCGS